MSGFSREMQDALRQDAEKLSAMTGEEHTVEFFDFEEPQSLPAPCPHCFESSGYAGRVHPHTWDDPAWEDADPTRPCPYCDATGFVDSEPVTLDDLEAQDAEREQ